MADPSLAASPAWFNRLMAELDANDQNAKNVIVGLTTEQLNWQPAPGAWSIGQCLEHLCITNEDYVPAITAALEDQPASAVQEITPGWFARWFIRSFIEPSPDTKRATAPKKIRPGNRVELSILERFLRSNDGARKLMQLARTYNVNRIRFVNPFLPILRFTVGTGMEIISGHERRHLLQAERVKQSANFPH